MNATRLAIVAILGSALIAAVLMYYQLVYAGYAELTRSEVGEIQLVSVVSGEAEPIVSDNVKAIDTVTDGVRLSGAISFRACFETPQSQAMLSETFVIFEDAVPLNAPPWFDCFDAQEIGLALEEGNAIAFMSEENISFGVDRVVAVLPDGRGFVWHQLNACGEAVFDGENNPEGCPDVPEISAEET
ncbi:DUF6446 family protein [Octadecabacter sp. 1_MG-2023]|uniref:DUF6446 family protein n=1 Tax=unclassified Octadecabacter TaxID=196158 RepID=UPI001C099DD2|nr:MULTISPECIES: DUF6446 family protein [unclassified Octadecabacter]MBU2992788.1 histidine kinase [Octadecabacter sp. B2R22]MDO6733761.1 DUF6446 family protein [Octadecabacter sp. 1_MG-2023]